MLENNIPSAQVIHEQITAQLSKGYRKKALAFFLQYTQTLQAEFDTTHFLLAIYYGFIEEVARYIENHLTPPVKIQEGLIYALNTPHIAIQKLLLQQFLNMDLELKSITLLTTLNHKNTEISMLLLENTPNLANLTLNFGSLSRQPRITNYLLKYTQKENALFTFSTTEQALAMLNAYAVENTASADLLLQRPGVAHQALLIACKEPTELYSKAITYLLATHAHRFSRSQFEEALEQANNDRTTQLIIQYLQKNNLLLFYKKSFLQKETLRKIHPALEQCTVKVHTFKLV